MIIVMGMPGAGKTTILKSLKTDYKLVNYGDLMLEIEKKEFGIKDRDEMRKLPIEKQKVAQKLAAEALSKMPSKTLLDTHCSISTPSGYFPGLPFELLKMLKVDSLVLVTANVEEIAERRRTDKTRVRDTHPPDYIEFHVGLHDFMNKSYLAAYSAFTGAPAVIIHNKQGRLEESVAQLQALLK
jgi:adenylate kinase